MEDGQPMDEPATYEIRLKGHLDERGARRFEGLVMTLLPDGITLLAGPVRDQAALHGVLALVRDMGVSLLSIQRVAPPLRDRRKASNASQRRDRDDSSN